MTGQYIRTDKHRQLLREGWHRRTGASTATIPCLVCGESILVYPSRAKLGKSKFCSRACKATHLATSQTRENNPNWRGGRHLNKDGYIMVRHPDHPRANPAGYVREHIIIAESALGKPLPEGAIVHHINEDKTDNRNHNLVICEGNGYHQFLHERMRVIANG
jgi:hypothetical protein